MDEKPDTASSFHPAIVIDDWWKWEGSGTHSVTATPSGLMRRSKFGDTEFVVENRDVIGLALTLGESSCSASDQGLDRYGSQRSPPAGMIAIMAPGESTKVRIKGDARFLIVGISVPALLDTLSSDLERDVSGVTFTTLLGHQDPVLERALFRLATVGRAEGDEAMLDVAARVVLRHSSLASRVGPERRVSLTAARLRRVTERIEAELARPLSLSELAGTAGISAYHFAREFQRSTGYAPHRFLIRRRVDRAVQLMATTRSSITDIAQEVGFHSASHMARHMQRLLGLAPLRLRTLL